MSTTKSLIEIVHDEGYGDSLLMHINHAFGSKDMRARRVVEQDELLEALIAMVNANDGVAVMPTPEARQQNAALKQAKAAIKKATGE